MQEYITLSLVGISFLSMICQYISWWVRIPSILFLLIPGLVLGTVLGYLNPHDLLGDLLYPIISFYDLWNKIDCQVRTCMYRTRYVTGRRSTSKSMKSERRWCSNLDSSTDRSEAGLSHHIPISVFIGCDDGEVAVGIEVGDGVAFVSFV